MKVKDQKKKTACLLGYFFYDYDSRIKNYVKYLTKRNYSVDIIGLGKKDKINIDEKGNTISSYVVKDRKKKENNRFKYLGNFLIFFFLAMFKLNKLCIRNKYQFIHVHNVPDFLVFTALIPKLLGIKVLFDIHDIVPEFYARRFKVDIKNPGIRVLRFIEKMSCQFSDHVIIANDIWKEKLIGRSVQAKHITAIPNFPDNKLFAQIKKETFLNDKSPLKLIYHGSFTEYHGLDIAIKAISIILKNNEYQVQLNLYGGGPYKEELQSLVRSLKLEENVYINDGVLYENIPNILKDADIGIVPKKNGIFSSEAMSTKLFEYASVGLPIVAARNTVELYYFDENEVKYFTPCSSEDMARCIIEFYNDPELRQKFAQNALKKMKQYSQDINEDKYFNIIQSLNHRVLDS